MATSSERCYCCEVCGLELDPGTEHANLAYCVAALVEYVKGSEQTTDDQLTKLSDNLRAVEITADQAANDAREALDRVGEMENK